MSSVSLRTFFHPRNWYALLILAYVLIVSWMPRRVIWGLGSALGWFFVLFPSPAYRIASRNIELCFPDLSPRERQQLVRRHFRVCGIIWMKPWPAARR
jgi:KDO2-lipid IV(A) lauroyltransferase